MIFRTMQLIAVMIMLSSVVGCASHRNVDQKGAANNNADPYEGVNRAVFGFNVKLDRWILKPVAKGYDFVTPDFVQRGVGNFFGNLSEVSHVANDALQWKWMKVGNDSGRFIINSTIGIAGIFDVADKIGLKDGEGEDFGQTLAHWGIKQGPYIVLPFLGPTTVRNSPALFVDGYVLDPVTYIESSSVSDPLRGLRLVHNRAELFELEELASGDLYLFVRDTYLQRRKYLESDGVTTESYEDDFGSEDF